MKIANGGCPECGKKFFYYDERQIYYGSMIRECKKCKSQYIDLRYHEIEIDGINKKELSLFPYIFLILFGAFLVYRGYHLTNSHLLGSPEYSGIILGGMILLFGIIAIIGGIVEIIQIKTGRKAQKFEKLKAESEERLSHYDYAQTLKNAGINVPEKYL